MVLRQLGLFQGRVTFPRRIRRRKWNSRAGNVFAVLCSVKSCRIRFISSSPTHSLPAPVAFGTVDFPYAGNGETLTVTRLSSRRYVAPKTRYKSRRPISFYRDAVIGELPRKPPGQCSSGYYVGSAITVSVLGFISPRCCAATILVAACAHDLLSPSLCPIDLFRKNVHRDARLPSLPPASSVSKW